MLGIGCFARLVSTAWDSSSPPSSLHSQPLVIATDRFVYVHQPKTGGTFVTAVLFRLADVLGTRELKVRTPRTAFVRAKLKHGTCRDVPRALRDRPVWTTVRNPFDQYVSEYAFGWWRRGDYPRHFRRRVRQFGERYPDYPDLEFEGFLRLYHEAFGRTARSRRFTSDDGVGWLTEQFVQYYARRPRRLLRRLRPDADPAVLRDALFPVRFLQTERLNDDLHRALLDAGLDAGRVAFVREHDRVLPEHAAARDRRRDWRTYYTPELRAHVRRNDALLFRLFPEYDVP